MQCSRCGIPPYSETVTHDTNRLQYALKSMFAKQMSHFRALHYMAIQRPLLGFMVHLYTQAYDDCRMQGYDSRVRLLGSEEWVHQCDTT